MHVGIGVFQEKWDALLNSEFLGDGPFAKKPVKGNGYLGISTEPSNDGLKVTKVGDESPARKAGIRSGDLLIKLNDKALQSREDLQALLKELSAGDEVRIEIRRSSETKTFTLKLDER
jgi:serine protease Do